jgi:hypothetical protein
MKVIPKLLPLLSDLRKPSSSNGQSSAVRANAKKSGNKITQPHTLHEHIQAVPESLFPFTILSNKMRSDSDTYKHNPRFTASDLTYPRNQMIRPELYLRAAEPPKIFLPIVLDTPKAN